MDREPCASPVYIQQSEHSHLPPCDCDRRATRIFSDQSAVSVAVGRRAEGFETWFPGVHCDVGGGYPESESGLSKITLQWMMLYSSIQGELIWY
jgi:hypothetical protein